LEKQQQQQKKNKDKPFFIENVQNTEKVLFVSISSKTLQIHGKFNRTGRANLNKLSCQVGKPGPVIVYL